MKNVARGGGNKYESKKVMKTKRFSTGDRVACWAVVCLGGFFFLKLMGKNMERTSSKPSHLSPGVENFRTLRKVANLC